MLGPIFNGPNLLSITPLDQRKLLSSLTSSVQVKAFFFLLFLDGFVEKQGCTFKMPPLKALHCKVIIGQDKLFGSVDVHRRVLLMSTFVHSQQVVVYCRIKVSRSSIESSPKKNSIK